MNAAFAPSPVLGAHAAFVGSTLAVLGAHAAFVGSAPQESLYLFGIRVNCRQEDKRRCYMYRLRETSQFC